MHQFQCLRCATCCTLSPITLLPHEAIVLLKLAEELNIRIEIAPSFTIEDRKNRIWIALSYILKLTDSKCPFLSHERTCLIHDLYKPLICRSFPFVPSFVRYFIDHKFKRIVHISKYGISSVCSFVKKLQNEIQHLKEKVFEPYLIPSMFPDEYEAYYVIEYLRMSYLNAISRMWQEGILEIDLHEENLEGIHIVNAYYIVKPFVDIAILMTEDPRYLLLLSKVLNIRIPGTKESHTVSIHHKEKG